MPLLLDAAYALVLLLLSPWLVYKALTTGKYRRGLVDKFFGPRRMAGDLRPGMVWFHGVSVGEIHLLRQVVARFRQRYPGLPCAVSATTDTGFDEARKAFPDLPVFWFPLDFSWAVRRALRRLDPALVVLAEGELWPNLLLAARRRGVPVAVLNARMSPRSLRRYRLLTPLARPLVRSLALVAAQTEEFAAAFRALGAEPDKVRVTGNVKFDGVSGDRNNPRTAELRQLFGLRTGEPVWVAGSTQAPEEEICLEIFARLRSEFPGLRLFLVPRQKDRFDGVARLLERGGLPFLRRSALTPESAFPGARPDIVLVDTIGELGALWGLADVAFVGGSLDGKRGGQNMIEPAAYGAAVVFGPHVWNFRDTAARLVGADAARQVNDTAGLEAAVRELLGNARERGRAGEAAREFVARQQGATGRTVDLLGELVAGREGMSRAA
jgi:3-deoxy-D-manno-octulosonic-acid transferase